jgi:uncharacterized RDD family membrane protein YckC
VERRSIGSWLEGPPRPESTGYPGERLGRPAEGPGSVARFGRRLVGILVDWVIALTIARWLFGTDPLAPLGVLAVEHLLLVGTLGSSIGHRVAGLRLETVAGGYAGPVRAAVRTALLCLVVPAAIWDADQRGLHDKAAGTVLVRT